jgi:hypothetical protein
MHLDATFADLSGLVIRTAQLLLMVEQSLDQEVNHSGKAIVIGSWDQ